MRPKLVVCAAIGLALGAASAPAEPTFLSRQYTRCTTCHYSATGGGLLTPYGRSLSRQELSTIGRTDPGTKGTEEAFLYGLLGDALGPVQVGIDVRPAHLHLDFGDGGTSASPSSPYRKASSVPFVPGSVRPIVESS